MSNLQPYLSSLSHNECYKDGSEMQHVNFLFWLNGESQESKFEKVNNRDLKNNYGIQKKRKL